MSNESNDSSVAAQAVPACTVVYNINNLDPDWVDHEWANGIDLRYAEGLKEHRAQCKDIQCRSGGHEQCTEEFSLSYENDHTHMLIGKWNNLNSMYVPAPDGEFAAIMHDTVIQCVWSRNVQGFRSWCSLCYPIQIDGDSGAGSLLGYALPEGAIPQGEEVMS